MKKRERKRKNVDVMPITTVDGVGLGDGDSEEGGRRWRRWSGFVEASGMGDVGGGGRCGYELARWVKLSLDDSLTTSMQIKQDSHILFLFKVSHKFGQFNPRME